MYKPHQVAGFILLFLALLLQTVHGSWTSIPKRGKRSNYRRRKYRRTIAKEGLGDAKEDKGK
jgi:hypothetical protein